MKKAVFSIFFFLILSNAFCQQIRTFNTLNLAPTFSKKLNTFNVSYGEMIQIKRAVPYRFLVSVNYSANLIKKGTWDADTKLGSKSLGINKNFLTSKFSIPIGFEIFSKNFGIGISQEILTISNKKTIDSSKVQVNSPYSLQNIGASSILSSKSKNNTSTSLYVVYTLSDSFSLLGGINRDQVNFNYFRDSKKVDFSKYSEISAFLSIRINIEK